MLEAYIKVPEFREKLGCGAAGQYIEGFAKHLFELGYSCSAWCARQFLYGAAHLTDWAQRSKGIRVEGLSEDLLARFKRHLGHCRCPRPKGGKAPKVILGCQLFLNYLHQIGVVTDTAFEQKVPTYPPVVQSFRDWMKQHRNVTQRTLEQYSGYVCEMLRACGEETSRFDAQRLRRFVFERTRNCGRGSAKMIVTALRMFLRHLIAEGKCHAGLDHALPTLAHWPLSTLPRYLSSSDVERVIAACDDEKAVGARDRAIVLLLARLALRASDVYALRLQDIDWQDASLCVSGKGRRQVRLPLSQEVGDAILSYLKHRPPLNTDKVFVRVQPPLKPFKSAHSLTGIVERALRRADVEAPCYGPHVLRHSAATTMLRQGVSLQDIQAVLRHRSIRTTERYAKVDLALLKRVAQPWPEVNTC
jgi:integrase/recombinase XerD